MNDPGGPATLLVNLAPFAMILLVFYFLLVRPQQERAREIEKMLAGLRVNDPIVTNGGLHGRIVKLEDKVVTVEVAPKVQVRVDRTAVGQVIRGGKNEEKS